MTSLPRPVGSFANSAAFCTRVAGAAPVAPAAITGVRVDAASHAVGSVGMRVDSSAPEGSDHDPSAELAAVAARCAGRLGRCTAGVVAGWCCGPLVGFFPD